MGSTVISRPSCLLPAMGILWSSLILLLEMSQVQDNGPARSPWKQGHERNVNHTGLFFLHYPIWGKGLVSTKPRATRIPVSTQEYGQVYKRTRRSTDVYKRKILFPLKISRMIFLFLCRCVLYGNFLWTETLLLGGRGRFMRLKKQTNFTYLGKMKHAKF